jgi:hypothetical protein
VSEFYRADYRGNRTISAYQVMGICSIPYAVVIALWFSGSPPQSPDILKGLRGFWDPGVILFLEALWAATFVFTGRSDVTGATLRFHVIKEKI